MNTINHFPTQCFCVKFFDYSIVAELEESCIEQSTEETAFIMQRVLIMGKRGLAPSRDSGKILL